MSTRHIVPRGTSDILPKDSYKWQYMEATFRQVAKVYGYQEISTPIFEHVEVFERSAGDTTDIVQKEMYRFSDKKGRIFALRPEGTAPVIRSYIENNLHADGQVVKLYYIGAMFRYDRPQAGRSRQFSQYGAECIGSPHPYFDAETIAFFYTYLTTLGLSRFVVEINSIGCESCSVVYNATLREYFAKLIDQLCDDCKLRYENNPKRLLDCKVEKCKEFAKNAPSMLAYLDESCQSHFAEVQKFLEIMSVPFVVNPRIVRGLDYYGQTAFEFINHHLGSQNALGGGGRYDGLVEAMGGKHIPAVGYAGGFSRLLLSMEKENLFLGERPAPTYYIASFGDKATEKAIEIAHFLRQKAVYVEFDIEKTSMKAQMRSADKSKADYTIIIGADELASGNLAIKDMATGEQSTIPIDKVSDLIK
jgi:histidyl-tRNA synthetase